MVAGFQLWYCGSDVELKTGKSARQPLVTKKKQLLAGRRPCVEQESAWLETRGRKYRCRQDDDGYVSEVDVG